MIQATHEGPATFAPERGAKVQTVAPLLPIPARLSKPFSLGRAAGMLRLFGPTAIVLSVCIVVRETIVAVRADAWLGHGLLWLVVLIALVKVVRVTYFLGRYTTVSGELPAGLLVRLPRPRGGLLIFSRRARNGCCAGGDPAQSVLFGYVSANERGWPVGKANPSLKTGSIAGAGCTARFLIADSTILRQ